MEPMDECCNDPGPANGEAKAVAGESPKETLNKVVDSSGRIYELAENTQKNKVYGQNNKQISKACHWCGQQHIYWQCGKGCGASYCSNCLDHAHCSVTKAITDGCPKCRDQCICRKCLLLNNRIEVTTLKPEKRMDRLIEMLKSEVKPESEPEPTNPAGRGRRKNLRRKAPKAESPKPEPQQRDESPGVKQKGEEQPIGRSGRGRPRRLQNKKSMAESSEPELPEESPRVKPESVQEQATKRAGRGRPKKLRTKAPKEESPEPELQAPDASPGGESESVQEQPTARSGCGRPKRLQAKEPKAEFPEPQSPDASPEMEPESVQEPANSAGHGHPKRLQNKKSMAESPEPQSPDESPEVEPEQAANLPGRGRPKKLRTKEPKAESPEVQPPHASPEEEPESVQEPVCRGRPKRLQNKKSMAESPEPEPQPPDASPEEEPEQVEPLLHKENGRVNRQRPTRKRKKRASKKRSRSLTPLSSEDEDVGVRKLVRKRMNGVGRMSGNQVISGTQQEEQIRIAPEGTVAKEGEVIGQGRVIYAIGQHMKKNRVFNETGKVQISKSCHQCQDQHIAYTCKKGMNGCMASYCRRCWHKYYQGLTFEEVMEKCPRCRGFCNCRACLRMEFDPAVPKYSKAEVKNYARHVLQCTGGYIKQTVELYEQEVAFDGMTLEEVTVEPPNSTKINCDRCSTSIPDFHRACDNCCVDLCVHCCSEVREEFGEVTCSKCGNAMAPKKLLDKQFLTDLRQIAKDYGNCFVGANYPSCTTAGPSNGQQGSTSDASTSSCLHWSEKMGLDKKRLASERPASCQNYVFSPDASDFKGENKEATVQTFQECMRRGEPVIVRNVKPMMDWRPETMCRATVEKGNRAFKVEAKPADVVVIDCGEHWGEWLMKQSEFFTAYIKRKQYSTMLKVKDWPPEENFRDRLKRHNQDFLEMLPMVQYTNPNWGPLNMHRALPEKCLPPDLGPKTYIALGRKKEHPGEGDSVTKLHVDMSDAVNILVHSHYDDEEEVHVRTGTEKWDSRDYGNAGAVWDILRREDCEKVAEYLRSRQDKFVHNGKPVSEHGVKDPIHEQMFQLGEEDRENLRNEYGVHVWHFEQHMNEAVYIPAGNPHQVRNLRSCIKVAVDFVPPESAPQVLNLVQQLRTLAKIDLEAGLDKLQGLAMMLYASREALHVLQNKLEHVAWKTKQERKPKRKKPRQG